MVSASLHEQLKKDYEIAMEENNLLARREKDYKCEIGVLEDRLS